MAEYYTSGISRKRTKRTRRSTKPIWLILLDGIAYLFMAVLIALSLIVLVCQYISPAKVGILSIASLAAPIIYLLDIAVALYWVARLRWRESVAMALVVVVGALYAPRYFATNLLKDRERKYVESRYTKILTYNLKAGLVEGLADSIMTYRPDIICLQEASLGGTQWTGFRDRYNSTYNPKTGGSVHIFTNYRILKSGQVGKLARQNGIWADVIINKDTVRIINLHLRSTTIRSEDTRFLEQHEYLLDTARSSKLSSIVSRLVENNVARAEQAEAVAEFLEEVPYPVVLTGDFNDVPLSYTYNTVRGDLTDTFLKGGNNYAYTYNTAYHILRIDHIFLSPSIKVESYEVDTTAHYSDHYPVIVRAKFPQRR